MTAFFSACLSGDSKRVEMLLEDGVSAAIHEEVGIMAISLKHI
jgi:hypothetical protein